MVFPFFFIGRGRGGGDWIEAGAWTAKWRGPICLGAKDKVDRSLDLARWLPNQTHPRGFVDFLLILSLLASSLWTSHSPLFACRIFSTPRKWPFDCCWLWSPSSRLETDCRVSNGETINRLWSFLHTLLILLDVKWKRVDYSIDFRFTSI